MFLNWLELTLWRAAKRISKYRRRHGACEWNDFDIEQINAEMADGCLAEIAEALEVVGCCHGHKVENTPPMFYPEMILCAVKNAKAAN